MKTIQLSNNQEESLYSYLFEPIKNDKVIVQIIHGAGEHVNRYKTFIATLNQAGFTVIMHNHPGHGPQNKHDAIHIEKHASSILCAYTLKETDYIKTHYKDYAHYIVAHSLGAYIIRALLTENTLRCNGIFLIGTANIKTLKLSLVRFITACLIRIKGANHVHKGWLKLTQDQAYKRLKKKGLITRRVEWLTRDVLMQEKLRQDPLSKKLLTLGAQREIYRIIHRAQQKHSPTSPSLPLMFYCGGEDPLCDFGDGLNTLKTFYSACGYKTVNTKVFPKARHELLNCIVRKPLTEEIIDTIKNVKT